MITKRYVARYDIPVLEDAIEAVASGINGVHEACQSVPQIGRHDFDRLVNSIKAHGLLRPIEIDSKNLLLDGRSRLQACAVAGVKLGDGDIVVTTTDPDVIASSNNARRHLTPDQKTMEAARLLEKEKELAAQRQIDGGAKGRLSKQSQLGTKSVPSETQPKKREPRAKDRVAAETGVSREKLTVAERLIEIAPETAKLVEQDALSLKEAAEKTGVVIKKAKKPSPAAPATPVPTKKLAKAKSQSDQTQWKDEFAEVIDRPDGIRMMRCKDATFYIHKTKGLSGFALSVEKEWWWWWFAVPENDLGTTQLREDAENRLLAGLIAQIKNE